MQHKIVGTKFQKRILKVNMHNVRGKDIDRLSYDDSLDVLDYLPIFIGVNFNQSVCFKEYSDGFKKICKYAIDNDFKGIEFGVNHDFLPGFEKFQWSYY